MEDEGGLGGEDERLLEDTIKKNKKKKKKWATFSKAFNVWWLKISCCQLFLPTRLSTAYFFFFTFFKFFFLLYFSIYIKFFFQFLHDTVSALSRFFFFCQRTSPKQRQVGRVKKKKKNWFDTNSFLVCLLLAVAVLLVFPFIFCSHFVQVWDRKARKKME